MQEASSTPYLVSMAIKAAELQAEKQVRSFAKTPRIHFLENVSNPDCELLLACAKDSNIDVEEFKRSTFC